jgi:hypothetical protein
MAVTFREEALDDVVETLEVRGRELLIALRRPPSKL